MFVYNFKYITEETDQFTLDFYNEIYNEVFGG